MTLDGTRSYVLGAGAVVDPGPLDDAHLRALAGVGPVELILVTHRHADHTAGAARLRELTGAPVRAADPAHCHGGAPLSDGEVLDVAGLRIEVLATPGHTADSACFVVGPADGGAEAVVLTGDTVLGAGTTVIAEPDGSLADYLASLDRLEHVTTSGPRGTLRGLPGHGPVVEDLTATVRAYRAHRLERLAQVRAALAALGPAATADDVTATVYSDVPVTVRAAARQSVTAQLAYLRAVTR
ncbi:MBL fold metallo-hydrolase [Xylanimonas sp. McL0601]|uniref:MBL fold metallo-hydrolase n=1 Tax=Xylanimonas sp. McL0601 TaxID=3414739 RepID=UPI003CEEE038